MKKLALFLGLSSFLFAASNEEIINFYSQIIQAQAPNAKVSISKREKLASSNIESIILEIDLGNGEKQNDIAFTIGDFISADMINIKSGTSYRRDFELKNFQEAKDKFTANAKDVVKKESMVVKLGDNTKPKIYIFTDPECPFCREQLKDIENELANHQINLILTPVHGKSSFEKSALIYKESAKAKTDKDKIAILRKYYDENIKTYPKVSDAEVKKILELFEKYRALGLHATPTTIEE
ncbi:MULTISPECIES: thioredoxin fold domain-containing protein [unclassified Campylobacter]|uniref:thioredoxin fold domain-containing protein n=1 Tax=unclassified Campylobacter TaxID=2593542 RepID=UPI001237CCDD|nr:MULTISPECIES: thioredoxin fold domain-containing protein [unclassified Campylobacter]KAA6224985.1 hypothetical protein FMM55_08280 [Campylobacter sp. LR196d]KAA6225307.1 hypothetical protein FMM57_07960 [Campylobacter sp. LR286c]KAA6225574.1 hypothetical protein FMM54_05960 [Campylobacter sp. LR185c]KAA6230432.1 hypothetical protein FMM58_05450 [Campylobacter sp. LR291e]KAA6230542.1 hypothetical protein FMM56_05985 [Campylobacter sp. LR264d]